MNHQSPASRSEEIEMPIRSGWRQRLAETERGFTTCFRTNSSMFFYFFTSCVVISIAIVLEMSAAYWAVLTLSLSIAISSEILHFSIESAIKAASDKLDSEIVQLLKMAKASLMLLLFGAVITILILFGSRCYELYC